MRPAGAYMHVKLNENYVNNFIVIEPLGRWKSYRNNVINLLFIHRCNMLIAALKTLPTYQRKNPEFIIRIRAELNQN